MPHPATVVFVSRRLCRGLGVFLLAALLGLPAWAAAGGETPKVFDVVAGDAVTALKRAAQQAGLEIVFPAELVQGVKTNAVHGTFRPRDAFDRLTAGTVLVVVQDQPSGALIVRRRLLAPASAAPAGAKTAEAAGERVIRLEPLTVTTTVGSYKEATTTAGSKTPMNMRDVPGTVQVLNASFIGDKLAQSLEDLYPYVVGMTRESQAAVGFTLRGFTNNATNTLLNNIQYDGLSGGAARFGSPTTANVDRVEVIKGPNSVLYGALSPGGLINIVSKSPLAIRANSVMVAVSGFAGQGTGYGENLGYTATLDSSGPLDRDKHWLYRFITSFEELATFRQSDWGRNRYFYPSLSWRPEQNTEVTMKVEIIRQRRLGLNDQQMVAPFGLIALVPADHSLIYQDPKNREYDNSEVYSLSAFHRFANQWAAKYNVRTVQHTDGRQVLENRSVNSVLPVEESTITQRYRDTWNRRRYAYHDFTVNGDVGPENFRHTLLFGADYGFESENFNRWVFANVTGPAINVYQPVHNLTTYPAYNPATGPTQIALQKYYNYGLYFTDHVKIGQHWLASAGIHTDTYRSHYGDSARRLDGTLVNPGNHNNSRSTVPSFGVVYQPGDTLSFYASYAEGFKPSIAQAVDGFGVGRPPEKADQEEIGFKADFLNNTLGVLFCYYDITRHNVTEAPAGLLDANGVQIFRTLSQQNNGMELSVNYQPRSYLQLQLGYTNMDARVSATAQPLLTSARLANAPAHSGNVWVRYNVPTGRLRGFGVGFGAIYTGERNGMVSNVPADMLTIPANTRADLAFYYKWQHGDFAANITNLTNRSYIASADADTDVIPGAPRKITVSARFPF
ncbi:MAG: Iron complex outerrane recepter protein [Lacunisphaera sp.]|nr:Iron complex outerrane recepter protein [Lacunisphaera sp.]